MVRKSFRVTVCFDLHQVTCPGVWLCPKGKIFVTLSLFKCLETTKQVKPIFPLKYHQRFVFDKIFDSISSLGELENEMSGRNIRMELVQVFKGKLKMITLGVFQAPLTSVLYPSIANGSESGAAEVDLLFEACKPFPGIISPKAEVSTRAVIEELRLCPKFTDGPVNPTLVPSTMKCGRAKSRQRAVCHNRPAEGCTCCDDPGRIVQRRPKTTGSRLSPPATSTRCKAVPPRRRNTIEGGDTSTPESDGYQCEEFEHHSPKSNDAVERAASETGEDQRERDHPDDNRQEMEKNRKAQRKEEDSSLSDTERQNRNKRPEKKTPWYYDQKSPERRSYNQRGENETIQEINSRSPLRSREGKQQSGHRKHTVRVDVHVNPSDQSENEQQSQNSRYETSQREYSDSNKKNLRQKSDIKSKPATASRDQEVQYDSTYDDKRPACDCVTCIPCRKTIESLMVPWKVYAAPPSYKPTCNHGKQEESRNQVEEQSTKFQDNFRRVVASHSATTQTSGICRCEEANEFSAANRQPTNKSTIGGTNTTNVQSNKHERGRRPGFQQNQPKSTHSPSKKTRNKNRQNQSPDNEDCPAVAVQFMCPCGCIDFTQQQRKELEKGKRGTVEQRITKQQTSVQVRSLNTTNKCCGNTGTKSKTATPPRQDVTMRHLPNNYHTCFCPKNKNG